MTTFHLHGVTAICYDVCRRAMDLSAPTILYLEPAMKMV